MECSYDMLDDMLPRQRQPDCWQFGWDLQDAFFYTGRWQEHADYMRLRKTPSRGGFTGTTLRCLVARTVRVISSASRKYSRE
jgi:hypothetical protein